MSNESPFGEVIYSYSRAQAIEDGVLVDLTQIETIRKAWRYPVACTSTVWAIIEAALEKPGQDLLGIAHDISWTAKQAIRRTDDPRQLNFEVIIAGATHAFKLHIGPGDTLAPVLTLMMPHED